MKHQRFKGPATTFVVACIAILMASETPAEAVFQSGRCLDVPASTIADIELGIRATRRGRVAFTHYQAVRSNDLERIYFVSAMVRVNGRAEDWEIATWAINRLDHSTGSPGSVFAMPDAATTYTDWGDASRNRMRLSAFDDGHSESRQCAEDHLAANR
jgi:hypothetical protein